MLLCTVVSILLRKCILYQDVGKTFEVHYAKLHDHLILLEHYVSITPSMPSNFRKHSEQVQAFIQDCPET